MWTATAPFSFGNEDRLVLSRATLLGAEFMRRRMERLGLPQVGFVTPVLSSTRDERKVPFIWRIRRTAWRWKLITANCFLLRHALLFAVRANDAINRVWSSARGFMVMADLQFAQQTNCKQVQSGQQQHGGKDHEWAMLRHDRSVTNEFLQ